MMAAAGRVLAGVLTLVGLLWPVLAYGAGGDAEGAYDPAVISDYRADLTVDEHGMLTAHEVITTRMPDGRHGIFRFWDVADAGDDYARLVPEDITVTEDGGPATVDLSWQEQRRYRVARIGRADVTLTPGEHRYDIRYSIDGVLAEQGDGARFHWDVVARAWQMPVERSEVRVALPGSVTAATCTTGTFGPGCAVATDGTGVVVTATGLQPRTGVTLVADVAAEAPDRVTLPWPTRFDAVLSRSLPVAVLLLLLGVVGGVAGWFLARQAREPRPGHPVLYAPPDGVGPVQAYYVAEERVPDTALQATLLHQAEQGLTRLERRPDDTWVVQGAGTAEQWRDTDDVTRAVGESLGLTRGGRFVADDSVETGKRLVAVKAAIGSTAKQWARASGHLSPSMPELASKLLVGGAVLLAGVLFVWNPFGVTALGLPTAAFAVGGVPLLAGGVGTRRTPSGRELWSRTGGFRRMLSTPSAEQRFEFSGREQLYTAYVPWAVAFGAAEAWAEKYRTETGQEPATPVWLAGGTSTWGGTGTDLGGALDSFESSLQSSISAYEATQRSSSSGGGGVGGGGGGGGGGGSW
jgi:hypothetical protein